MTERKCPDCGDRLSFDAQRCMCGWGAKKFDKGQRAHDMRCTYRAGETRCSYPVALFVEGATSGWCVFHRRHLSQIDGAEVVRQSTITAYSEAIKPLLERSKNSPGVVEVAHEIALRHGNRPWQAGNERILSEAIRRAEAA